MTSSSVAYSAPAKLILTGEHSVAHGKLAVAAAISLRCRAVLSWNETKDASASVTLLKFESHFSRVLSFNNSEILQLRDKLYKSPNQLKPSPRQLEGVTKLTSKLTDEKMLNLASQCFLHSLLTVLGQTGADLINQKFLSKNWTLQIESKVPLGAGLGSSAAVNTVIAACLLDAFEGIKCESSDSRLKQVDVERINQLAFASEHIVHGKPSGIDTYASSFGQAIVFENFAFTESVSIPQISVSVVNSKQERNTKELVGRVLKLRDENYTKFSSILTDLDLCSRDILTLLKNSSAEMSGEDFERFRVLCQQNHQLLQDFGVSTEKLDAIVGVAAKFGCAAKLTGAGGGGCAVIFLKSKTHQDSLVDELKNELSKLDVEIMTVDLGCTGVEKLFC